MRLLFSEYKSDYNHYIFPYAIWAIPEENEKASDIFAKGFLPSGGDLNRYYMCRHVRVRLSEFSPSSENRRILRKGQGIDVTLLSRDNFDWTPEWQQFCEDYSRKKFGDGVMTGERLDRLFQSDIVSHVLVYTDSQTKQNIGLVVLYLEPPRLAYYYYAFYDLDYVQKSLGMFMMTSTVQIMQEEEIDFIYLGSCYSKNALYKTQFQGAEFFNGFTWSENLNELKYLIKRDSESVQKHLLENEFFINEFYDGHFNDIKKHSPFQL